MIAYYNGDSYWYNEYDTGAAPVRLTKLGPGSKGGPDLEQRVFWGVGGPGPNSGPAQPGDVLNLPSGPGLRGRQGDEGVPRQHGGSHYESRDPQPIEVIEGWELGYNLGNAVKYIGRCGNKPGVSAFDDLSKAIWYLERERAKHTQGA